MKHRKVTIAVILSMLLILPGCELAADILATGVVIGVIAAVIVFALVVWAIAKFIDL